MLMNQPSIIGLDGIARPWDEVFAYAPDGCTQDARCGYVVRRTVFGPGAHSDVAACGPDQYGAAVDVAVRVRNEQGMRGHAVIDSLYRVGDTVIRVAG
jgi:hypothetical protein